MTTERQKAANRQNARSSTGPRSAEGKARASKNASRHGLTARLLVNDILAWFRLILDDPEAGEDPDGPLQEAALDLAAAETRLALARQAHNEFLLGLDRDILYEKGKAQFGAMVSEAMLNLHQETKPYQQLIRAAARLYRSSLAKDLREHERRARLLRRYLREAEMGREAALQIWIERLACESRNEPNFNF